MFHTVADDRRSDHRVSANSTQYLNGGSRFVGATPVDAPTVGELATWEPPLAPSTTGSDVDRLFRGDPTRRSVTVDAPSGPIVVNRTEFGAVQIHRQQFVFADFRKVVVRGVKSGKHGATVQVDFIKPRLEAGGHGFPGPHRHDFALAHSDGLKGAVLCVHAQDGSLAIETVGGVQVWQTEKT
jgi:hypothetical protein